MSADREALHDTLVPRHTFTRTGFILQIDRIERGRNLYARLEEAHADQSRGRNSWRVWCSRTACSRTWRATRVRRTEPKTPKPKRGMGPRCIFRRSAFLAHIQVSGAFCSGEPPAIWRRCGVAALGTFGCSAPRVFCPLCGVVIGRHALIPLPVGSYIIDTTPFTAPFRPSVQTPTKPVTERLLSPLFDLSKHYPLNEGHRRSRRSRCLLCVVQRCPGSLQHPCLCLDLCHSGRWICWMHRYHW